MPLAPEVTVNHDAVLTAVHVHEAGDVTANVPVAASFEMLAEVGAIVTVQVCATPSWLTGTAWPATVKVPDRVSAFGLAVTATLTVPGPEPLAPLPTDIHPRSDAAVHVHCAPVDTVIDALPPEAPKESEEDERENEQAAGGLGWVGDLLPHAQPITEAAPTSTTARMK